MLIRTKILMGPETGGVPAPSGGNASPAPSPSPSPTPAPSPSPTAAPAASSAATSNDGGGTPEDAFDFGALVDHYESGGEAPAPAPTAPAPASAPAASSPAPSVAPAVAPAVAAPAPVASPPPTEPPAQPAAAATAAPASGEPAQAAPQQVDWQKHRETFLPKLQEMYKMSDQEVQDFQTNPAEAIPKLAAELHYKVMMSLHSSMMELLPHAIENQSRLAQTRSKYEDQFYGKWPRLKEAVTKDPKVEETINEGIKAFRAANPKSSMDDLINKVGLLTMITLGLNPMEAAAAATPTPSPPSAVDIPGRPAGISAAAHVPVRQHGAAPGDQSEADFYADIANFHLSGN